MKIGAYVRNSAGQHLAQVETDGKAQSVAIPPKTGGLGSGINGGELLFLALATCYCNDIYREAVKRGLNVAGVEVEVTGEFGREGEPAREITYRAKVTGQLGEAEKRDLMVYVDRIAEIHNTLRTVTPVILVDVAPAAP